MKSVGEGDTEGNAMVLLPIASFDVPREIGVPDMVIPGPPGVRVVPAVENPVGLGLNV